MEEETKTGFKRKILDCFIFGGGLAGITDGVVRIANNPPEHLINLTGNLQNWQYNTGCVDIMVGGALFAYGIERIIKNSRNY